ncbi:uncharacterized protein LOC124260199 [Haliotis rubra]|uniref:uncharacterized protein LOC124260199 n=1 Tax=Haliotis rubra TaxID=36100 RepID=UPI001EE5A8C9|nr:uncharacterized protein LOC124260199 [Haliotis rubra]
MKQRTHRRERNRLQSNGKHGGLTSQTTPKLDVSLNTSSSDVGDFTGEEDIFPRFSPWVVCALTMAVRVNYVSQPRNWWILHPDEIFQSLEVAHSEVYGYGFRTHEYLPSTGTRTSPRCATVRFRWGCIALWKVVHAVVSSCLPLAVYKFTRILFRSHDCGVLAAILTAGSTHLSVFGTHTLINSFCGTPLFCGLYFLFKNLLCVSTNPNKDKKVKSSSDSTRNLNYVSKYVPDHEKSRESSGSKNMCSCERSKGLYHGFEHGDGGITGITKGFANCPGIIIAAIIQSMTNGISLINDCSRPNEPVTQKEDGVAERVYSKHELSPDSEMSALNDSNMNVITTYQRQQLEDCERDHDKRELTLASFILVICCYIRVDASLFVAATSLPHINRKCLQKTRLVPCIVGAVIGLAFCVCDDFNSYGVGVISPYSWFQFNVLQDHAAVVFGRMQFTWYLKNLIGQSSCLMLLTTYFFSIICVNLVVYKSLSHSDRHRCRVISKLAVSLVILMLIYSANEHKELRFMHNYLVLAFIGCSHCFYISAKYLKTIKYGPNGHLFTLMAVVLYILSQWYVFPSSLDQSNKTWTYTGNTQSHDVITCFDYVSKQNDVTGVFTDQMVHMSGGYTVLHQNVPIIGLLHYEFYEFSYGTRKNLNSANFFGRKTNVTVSTFSETSEFVSVYNTPYLLKVLVAKKHYNYLVMNTDRKFVKIGFREVFRSGKRRVLKRNLDAEAESQLERIAATIPLGSNATILTYEGDWLMRFRQFDVAIPRFQKALQLDIKLVEAYKLLALCYKVLGDHQSSNAVIARCVEARGKRLCYENLNRIRLHDLYGFQG